MRHGRLPAIVNLQMSAMQRCSRSRDAANTWLHSSVQYVSGSSTYRTL
jgi:hypothetical protein